MPRAIDVVAEAFQATSRGNFIQPDRVSMPDGSTLLMAAKTLEPVGTVVKVLTIRPDNPKLALPTIHATVLWIDDVSGEVIAVLEGSGLTALRTGAATGAATRRLASETAHVLAMLGAGVQAADQIRAVIAVRPITEVRIASRSVDRASALARAFSSELDSVEFTAVDTWAEAARGADVICCATPSTTPLIVAADLGPRVHINAVGAYTPAMAELGPDILAIATTIAVDQTEASLNEAGDIIQAIERGVIRIANLVELGTLLSGESTSRPHGCTIFKSVGIAAQDWAVARYAVKQALNRDDDLS